MSAKQLEISVYDKNSLLVKDYTLKNRWETRSVEEVLSDDIHLPGYENKPIKIGVCGDVTRKWPFIFIENSDFIPDDVVIYSLYSHNSTKATVSVNCFVEKRCLIMFIRYSANNQRQSFGNFRTK